MSSGRSFPVASSSAVPFGAREHARPGAHRVSRLQGRRRVGRRHAGAGLPGQRRARDRPLPFGQDDPGEIFRVRREPPRRSLFDFALGDVLQVVPVQAALGGTHNDAGERVGVSRELPLVDLPELEPGTHRDRLLRPVGRLYAGFELVLVPVEHVLPRHPDAGGRFPREQDAPGFSRLHGDLGRGVGGEDRGRGQGRAVLVEIQRQRQRLFPAHDVQRLSAGGILVIVQQERGDRAALGGEGRGVQGGLHRDRPGRGGGLRREPSRDGRRGGGRRGGRPFLRRRRRNGRRVVLSRRHARGRRRRGGEVLVSDQDGERQRDRQDHPFFHGALIPKSWIRRGRSTPPF